VIAKSEYLDKIRAASEARGDHDFFIVARTDAEQAVGLDEAIERVEAARQVGADASFVEAPGSVEQLAKIGQRAPKPIVANMIEGGKTPILSKEQLVDMGFQLILYPLAGLFAAAHGVQSVYQKLKDDHTTLGHEDQLMAFTNFNALIGVDQKYAMAERLGVR